MILTACFTNGNVKIELSIQMGEWIFHFISENLITFNNKSVKS